MRTLSTLAGLTLVAAAAAMVPAAAAQAATTPAAGIQLKVGHSNKCLNVAGNSGADLAKIIQYTCSTSATALNDKFKLVPQSDGTYWIQAVNSGKCLNVTSASKADNALIIQYTCGSAANNRWFVEPVLDRPALRFIGVGSGKCLNIPGNSTADEVQLIQYTCTTSTTKTNEQFYQPPTTSATPTARAFTTKQPVAVVQGAAPAGGGTAPVYYSWVSAENELTVLADLNPDPENTDPDAPFPAYSQTDGFGYTGRPQTAKLQDGRVQVLAHDAADGDVIVADEYLKGTGEFGDLNDIGGAFAGQPVLGQLGSNGALATFAVIGGQLWYAPQGVNNTQVAYGAWRNLGGTNLTGTPALVRTATGVRVFANNTSGQLSSAVFAAGQLSDWTTFTGAFTGFGVAAKPGNDSLLVGRTSAGQVQVKGQNADGSYADPTTVAGITAVGTPSAAADPATGRVAISVRDAQGQVWVSYETGVDTNLFGSWLLVSDLESLETLAAGDPTVFGYDVPSGASFGIAWPSRDADVDFPIVATFPSAEAAGAARSSARSATTLTPEFHKLSQPTRVSTLDD